MEKQPCGEFCQEQSTGSNTETARSDEDQHTNASTSGKPRRKNNNNNNKKKNKKKNKKNKNDNVKGDIDTTNAASQLDGNDGSAEVTTILKQLLVLAGSDINTKGDDQASVAVLEDSLRKKATAAFDRLRDPSVPVHYKTGDVQHAFRVIQKLNGLVKELTSPGKISIMDRHLQNAIFSEASHIIFMMQRLYRTDHPYIKAPALTPVRDLCDTCPEFTQFVVATARIGVSIDKKQQARAILDLLEKRFLKLRFQRAKLSCFRELVHTYSEARDEMGLGKTSNTDSFRALEWYITPTLDDYQAQINLDGMDGQPFYFELVTTAFQDTSKFERASAMVPGIACYGDSVKRIVYGGPKELLNRGRELVVAVAKAEGVRLSERNSQKCMASFRVGEFVFSAAGVCRDTAAA
ncbi:hypothetical protein PF005_g28056 [Phytophthora fragariae]|uniref:Uncharacterized protein n=1 Tax=Phytophthora fragariae TaxID=53985 RepID=A0A6A4BEY5_9STRA|nr:hypothetical protein PF003_g364 [Phytophthora fragariae]KAE8921000.1 hypothetical protein PF009_g28713 [Phytophthora fragariae]KAE9064179.1 hypothetical protein PF010_g28711 [Phytophthora fragariae]KAE9065385.1 hypothetical protein PF007_g28863 [Phytophthora fragariae]KAE9073737.1 hypothetical protein PF006_g28672 [Phytophthora fragariae]